MNIKKTDVVRVQLSMLSAGLLCVSLLSACGSDSNNTANTERVTASQQKVTAKRSAQDIELESLDNQRSLVENFPISAYITYLDNQIKLTAITSISTNWPRFNVYQAEHAHGYIDAASEEMFYHAAEQTNQQIKQHKINALDIEAKEQLLWFVEGDETIHRLNVQTEQTEVWQFATARHFTELALQDDGQNLVWLYDQKQHEILQFNALTAQTTAYSIAKDIVINGLSYWQDQLYILVNEQQNDFVVELSVDEQHVLYQQSWKLEGFSGKQFTDMTLLPDGNIVVSMDGSDGNLVQVSDKSETLGDGPIEQSAELELVNKAALDTRIAQPSGLWPKADGGWMLVTDKAEVFVLDAAFSVTEQIDFTFSSINCNQGCTEGVVATPEGFIVLADQGLIGHFSLASGQAELIAEYQIDLLNDEGEHYDYAGIAHNPSSGNYYLLTDGNDADEADLLLTLNADFSLQSQQQVEYQGDVEDSIYSYDAQGIAYYGGYLYAISEQFTKLLKLNLNGEILTVFELDHELLAYPSDIAIKDDKVYLIGDHENDEALPPVHIFALPDSSL
ncbi:hypothetical protein [Catenovulum sediminis]|uniref:Lipoprotein n=1 Tax=Catenovulum sediminis TaxID=1740262 RepID=A0ABV1RDI1_9ALTE